MKPLSVVISSEDWTALNTRLFTADGNENAAVLLCGASDTAAERRLLVRQIMHVPGAAYVARNAVHLEIAPSFYNNVVTRSLIDKLSPVLVHSHRVEGEARYSPSDDFGEQRLLGVLASLLPDATTASLVLTPRSAAGRQLLARSFAAIAALRLSGNPSRTINFGGASQ